jgi:hypothetical protein
VFLNLYRGRRVRRPTGVRFRHGFFWPVVNGVARVDRARRHYHACAKRLLHMRYIPVGVLC